LILGSMFLNELYFIITMSEMPKVGVGVAVLVVKDNKVLMGKKKNVNGGAAGIFLAAISSSTRHGRTAQEEKPWKRQESQSRT
jgi:hypothetical protein